MENLKKDWQDANVSISRDTDSINSIINGKRRTALENLIKRYGWFSNMGLIMLVLAPCSFLNSHLFPELRFRVAMTVLFCAFFLTASVMDRWLLYGLKGIDITRMSVMDVVKKALYYKKWHIRFIFILLPLALAILGFLAWSIDNLYFRIGMLCGFFFGAAMGIRQLLEFLADYRAIASED